MPGFVLLVRPRDDADDDMGVGFTVTKKIGNAVVRNRMKRRLRALVREIMPEAGVAGADHVLIGRSGGVERDYALLAAEMRKALGKARLEPKPYPGAGRDAGTPTARASQPGPGLRRGAGSTK